MIFVLNQFSEYIKTSSPKTLIRLAKLLFDQNTTRILPFEVSQDLKKYCLQSVSVENRYREREREINNDYKSQFRCHF
jgi:hypothetical protein